MMSKVKFPTQEELNKADEKFKKTISEADKKYNKIIEK